MGLEEHTLEQVGDRCEECGAPLTEEEQQAVPKTADQILDSIARYCTRINDSRH